MHVFLQFAFNADNLRDHLRTPWMEHYDFSYIDETIIAGIERNLPKVQAIIGNVEKRATGKVLSALSMGTISEQQSESGTHGGTMNQTDI